MSRSGRYFVVFFAVVLVAVGLISTLPFSNGVSVSTQTTGYWLKNTENFNTYGQFSINDTLYMLPNSTFGLNSVTFGYPAQYNGHLVAMGSSATSGSSSSTTTITPSISNNTLYVKVSISPGFQAGSNASVSLWFYVIDAFHPTNESNYNVPVLFTPSSDVQVDKVVSSIRFPYLTTRIANSVPLQNAGFIHTVGTNATFESWDYSGKNISTVSPRWNPSISVYSDPASSGAISFPTVNRQISIDSSGNLIVKDSITVRNLGENTLGTLNYSPLTNSTSLTVLPSTEPPLSNVGTTDLSNGQLNLNSMSKAVEPNSSETIIVKYPLAKEFWSFSNGVYAVNIPSAAPVNAIIGTYSITSSWASGIAIVSGGQLDLTAHNTTSVSGRVNFSYRLGIGSAFGSVLPLAGLIFIGVFIAGVVFRPRQEATEDIVSIFDSLVKAIEDKVSGTNDILSDLKSKGASATRNDIVVARNRIEEFRTKTSGRMGELRSQLSASSVTVQAGINEVVGNDREFDRAVRDVFNNYDQYVSKRMKEDTFLRVQQNNERRMQSVTNKLLDSAHDVREEYETEG